MYIIIANANFMFASDRIDPMPMEFYLINAQIALSSTIII